MRKIYHVTKTENGWQGKLEKGQRASVVGSTKAEVVQKTIEIAKRLKKANMKNEEIVEITGISQEVLKDLS